MERCHRRVANLDLRQKSQVASVLGQRAKLFTEAHAYDSAVQDYSMVLNMCTSNLQEEEEQVKSLDLHLDPTCQQKKAAPVPAPSTKPRPRNLTAVDVGKEMEATVQIDDHHDAQLRITEDNDTMVALKQFEVAKEAEATAQLHGHAIINTAERAAQQFEEEREDLMLQTLLRRGMVYQMAGQDELALSDLEVGIRMWRARSRALLVLGTALPSTPLLDRAVQLVNVLRFSLRVKRIGSMHSQSALAKLHSQREQVQLELDKAQDEVLVCRMEEEHARTKVGLTLDQAKFDRIVRGRQLVEEREHSLSSRLKQVELKLHNMTRRPGSKPGESLWHGLQVDLAQTAAQRGVSLIWLLEWTLRNGIPGHADWMLDSEQGVQMKKALRARGISDHGATRSISSVLCGDIVGPLKPGAEGIVVRTERTRARILVQVGSAVPFWYGVGDLRQLPLSPQDIQKRFEMIDEDCSGFLDRGEVAAVAASLGEELTEPQLSQAMEEMDSDGSGEVGLEEFSEWFQRTLNDPNGGGARFLSFTAGDRVAVKAEAHARLCAQAELPTLMKRAVAWAADHDRDENFDEPLPAQPTVQGVVDTVVKPSTAATRQSFATALLRRPVLQPATHVVVVGRHTPFWELLHGLLAHALGGIGAMLELRTATPAQLVQALVRAAQNGPQPIYHLDWLLVSQHPATDEAELLHVRTTAIALMKKVSSVVVVPHLHREHSDDLHCAPVLQQPQTLAVMAAALESRAGQVRRNL
jgi:hypothetical protein